MRSQRVASWLRRVPRGVSGVREGARGLYGVLDSGLPPRGSIRVQYDAPSFDFHLELVISCCTLKQSTAEVIAMHVDGDHDHWKILSLLTGGRQNHLGASTTGNFIWDLSEGLQRVQQSLRQGIFVNFKQVAEVSRLKAIRQELIRLSHACKQVSE